MTISLHFGGRWRRASEAERQSSVLAKNRRMVLRVGLLFALASAAFFEATVAADAPPADAMALNSAVTATAVAPYIRNAYIHDPSTLIKCKDEFWVFGTGRGVPTWHSKDLAHWEHGPSVFTSNAPPWVAEAVPANRSLSYWAPDVTYLNGRYLLYYSASTFGRNTSGIGLATSPTLDPIDPAYRWTDQGVVITSVATNDFNAIDPAIFKDTNGSLWLTFGSFWSGIKMVQLDPQTGKRVAPDSPMVSLAHYESIEASYLYQRGRYYYLFVNWGICCRGTNSTYSIHVGRSEHVTGPYLDREGKDMLYGGGTLLLETTTPYYGPGHAGIIVENGTNWLSCHYESAVDAESPGPRRAPRLAVMPLRWTADEWPQVDVKQEK
jgi:arabinan endo-1,5-alpha-L-arabinosidase